MPGMIDQIQGWVFRNRTAQKDWERAELGQAYLKAVLDNIVDGLITIDEHGIVQSYNKACVKIFGYESGEVIGRNISMLMPPKYAEHHDEYMANYKRTGQAKIIGIGREVEGRRKDGEIFPIDLSVAEVVVGSKRYFSGIVRDITERKGFEIKLRRSNEELEKFAYVASHDLKEPLRNIDNLAKWSLEDVGQGLIPDCCEKLGLLRDRVKRLETLLEDILSYSRAGRIIDKPMKIDIGEILGNLVDTHVPKEFRVDIIGPMPVMFSPRTPIEQIFANILSNAVKHHDKGKGCIEISCRLQGSFYEFVVQDDGPGIPPEYHQRVFEMFQTLKPRDEVDGSGLGMSIIKKLVEWQGGKVWIVSPAGPHGHGTAIHFLWPENFAGAASF
ncbi:MAG: PAS domain S-box protein [Micavibrio aeruginosavorus]|uniref:Sensor protein FixL n=1 Tax=Micavibrio aeruginosavorus TaxID=349221 RepID=A0A7T5R0J2_9BACT|nr:MAG: PAS domain S-box protein [Micavibrio aeruginosavorus]